MRQLKQMAVCRWISMILVVMMAVPAGTLAAAQPDLMEQRFEQARRAWKNGEWENARTALLEIMASWDPEQTRESFQGNVHLLMGAIAEKTDRNEESIQHFCLARTFLGDRIPLDELKQENFFNYNAACDPVQTVAISFRHALVLFLAEDYDQALETLKPRALEMQSTGADRKLQGRVSLLMGAVHEKLKNKNQSIQWFCRAKELLGPGHSVSWLELSKYRFYKKHCKGGVLAVAGNRKKRGGRFLGTLLGLAALGGIVWYLFINKNSPLKGDDKEEEKGEYTSITFRLEVTYKGLNSKGRRKLLLDGDVQHNELFSFAGDPNENSTCSDAITDKTIAVTKTITTNSVNIQQDYLNWDYVKYRTPGTNYKLLCSEWVITIQSYTWESGKADPGSPGVSGTDTLALDTESDCTRISQRVHNCSSTGTLTFNRPGSSSSSDTFYSSQTKVHSSSE
ncbi:MAG TPA: tetratricopeptide repeat protein [Candidatus Aminicenantes bacterium]|nr:tetratricopeptide repeat protein [Candidatus Aminicenantes bacterium]